ncbi:MAG: ABC transporter ATP-binding protein [Candidatus Omnitrophica bacterium]|nr:ABC transporter ATP-binding protein [Candidatus Omnitrophota bacterium]
MPGDKKRVTIEGMREALRLFRRFKAVLAKYRKSEIAVLAIGTVCALFSLVNPYLGKIILDSGILSKNAAVFLTFTAIGGTLYLVIQALEKGDSALRDRLSRRVRAGLTRQAFRKVKKISLGSFAGASSDEYVTKISSDIAVSAEIITNTPPDFVKAALKIILITSVISFINVKILIVILAYQLIAAVQMNYFTKASRSLAVEAYAQSRKMANALGRIFSQIYFVKASGRMGAMLAKCFGILAGSIRIEAAISRMDILSGTVSELSGKLFFGVVGIAGTMLVIKGRLTLGELGAIMAYMTQGSSAYSALLNLCRRVTLNRLPLERVAQLLDTRIDIVEKNSAAEIGPSSAGIEFRGVSFGYSGGRRILEKADLLIMPGERSALVGASGCGKTTIVNLILRLYDVDEGSILLDGRDVRGLKMRSICGHIGLAPQLPFIWGDSVRSNIAYGYLSIDDAAVKRAAGIAEIDSLIEGLPDGYDTFLSEMVAPLSQGQKQRIAIARAVAKSPRILILDEACSSLDSKTEEKIMENIKRELPGITLITVTHRLAAVKKMDRVYFLKSAGEMIA